MKVPIGLKKVAAMCVLKHKDKFLLLKRANEPNKGMYVPVGGKLEPFEDQITAVIRETHEEAGILLESAKFCGILIETSPTKYNWISYIYMAEIDDQIPPYCDEGVLEWIAIIDLLTVPTPPTDRWIYKYLLENKPFAFSAIYDEQLNMLELIEEIEGLVRYGKNKKENKELKSAIESISSVAKLVFGRLVFGL